MQQTQAHGGRKPAHTKRTVDALSDTFRALTVHFMADGVMQPGELVIVRQFRKAAGSAARADWSRRAGQSVVNEGHVNPKLEREWREIEREFGPDDDPWAA